ncbi:DUF4240 domain-containing protein [Streptomyces sp. NPDC091292]|uniref:DUF4240 domain-containing protein n=1 Tax=Streptomyces sp. NPDC091292 TaxID=3365991 RepID=UPI00381ACE59
MDTETFWQLIEDARAAESAAPTSGSGMDESRAVAERAAALLATRPAEEIQGAQQTFWNLMAASYGIRLWGAAYTINGGCSDDGFDYFRGWLIAQGREVFERAVADPDTLADSPAVRTAARTWDELECEAVLGIAWDAHRQATGEELPACWSVRYPDLDDAAAFDFDDKEAVARHLPKLAALYAGWLAD